MNRLCLRSAVLLAAACAALAGCGLGLAPTVSLITDRAEMAAYVDRFNAVQSDAKVALSYQEVPSQAVLDGTAGDLVIGEWLASPQVMDRMDPIGDIVKPGKIDPSWFYPKLLAMGSRDNRPVLVPLSFSLPTIVYLRGPSDLPSMFMPLDALRSMSKSYNKTDKTGSLIAAGFSPLWNQDFLGATALLFGARFRPGRNGLPTWDEEGLSRTVEYVRAWLADVNGGPAVDAAFSQRNRVQPWYKLLAPPGKTLFELVSFRDFFALPEERRRDFDFRWLSQESVIPVMDDVLFAGVLRSSRNKGGARAFLQWFCSLSTQRNLLDVNQARRIGVFGITDGFSALKSINEKELAQKYPLVLGHVPQESFLSFPDALPDDWVKVRDEVIRPWIMGSAGGRETSTLEKALEDWQSAQKK